jgi:hypothetical protein
VKELDDLLVNLAECEDNEDEEGCVNKVTNKSEMPEGEG